MAINKKGAKVLAKFPGNMLQVRYWGILPTNIGINVVIVNNKPILHPAGKGEITVDSGAGESVCPTKMLPQEPLRQTTKVGTLYRAVGGQALTNKGEKKITSQSGDVWAQ